MIESPRVPALLPLVSAGFAALLAAFPAVPVAGQQPSFTARVDNVRHEPTAQAQLAALRASVR